MNVTEKVKKLLDRSQNSSGEEYAETDIHNNISKNFNRYIVKLGNSLGLDLNGDAYHTLDLTAENKLLENLSKNSLFGLINVIKTTNQEGDTLGIHIPIASTVDTNVEERTPTKGYISPIQQFNCEQINIDTFVSYEKLDRLANYLDKDFEQLFDSQLTKQMLLSLLMIGFNGKSRSNHSNPDSNPLAQDVKKGWVQKIKENAPEKIITAGNVGAGEKYKNLKTLINAAKEKISYPSRLADDLIILCGRNILDDRKIIVEYSDLSQDNTGLITISQELISGLKAISVPFFPENCVLITSLKNISLYLQSGTVRRFMKDEARHDRIANYISMSLDFIIEDYNALALIENINIID
ncbi:MULTISPECIES: P2 family phage major capsid protein [unclassified Avibacterium]|uniref:P2 family phage major capsid protein n=1 Tax=unclassified Avibacterium TaxID=2685287 RepID=UPI002026A729|nr:MULTISPECIES: P2 family phage major capsid protein [unclassified Avibacterium]MCW9698766.1 phage major capsid protein, P2 family [Avibacterium sp. 20-129]URL07011.1 phage major capsid protein, P2 family [Avibacterium sp. 21-595]